MSFSNTLLKGKVGLVTGAGSPYGIGRSLVLGVAAAGARAVYATDINLDNIESLQKEVKDSGSSCIVHGALLDVTSEEQTLAVVKEALKTYQRFDFYFANAGVGSFKPLEHTDVAHYDRMISIMQRSAFLAIKFGGQAMNNLSADKNHAGGAIVVTSSMAGTCGAVSDISYSTAKAAASHMVKSASVQLAASNVRVNAIAPGFIRTSIVSSSIRAAGDGKEAASYDKTEAMKSFDATLGRMSDNKYYYNRIAEPKEIANIGVFLVSELAASINGQNIVADSGKIVAALGETVIGPVQPLNPLQ